MEKEQSMQHIQVKIRSISRKLIGKLNIQNKHNVNKKKKSLKQSFFFQVKEKKKTVLTCKNFFKKLKKRKIFVKRKYTSFSPIINSIME